MNSVLRRVSIALVVGWGLLVFIILHSPALCEKSTYVQTAACHGYPDVCSDVKSCIKTFIDSSSSPESVFGVIASTHDTALAPETGLVLPGTKNRKPVHVMLFDFPHMLFEYIPMRNFRGIARLARLLATRNQYRRVDFMYAYMSDRRFLWYSEYCKSPKGHNTCFSNRLYVPIPQKVLGGGHIRATWSGRELNQYCSEKFAPEDTIYTFVEYKVKTPVVGYVCSDDVLVSVPLAYLAVKLPIRTLVDVCASHGIRISRSHDNRESALKKIEHHNCTECTENICVFRPMSSLSRDEKPKDLSISLVCMQSSVDWKPDQLRSYTVRGVILEDRKYRLVSYMTQDMSEEASQKVSIIASIPLRELADQASIRCLSKICACHGIAVSKRRCDHETIKGLIYKHDCKDCRDWVCGFEPLEAPSGAARVQLSRKVDQNKDYCKKWRDMNRFPPSVPSTKDVKNVIQGFVKDSDFSKIEERGCAVCGCLTLKDQLTDLNSSGLNTSLLYRPEVTRKPRSSNLDPIETLPGPVLAPGCDGVCVPCHNAMKRGRVPKNALANGLWLGEVPDELKGLSWMERRLIARISTNTCVIRVHASKLYKMRTNVVCRAVPMKKIYDVLPPKREEFEEVLAILFIGPSAPTPKEYKRTPLLVRRDRVSAALEWLKLNHADYSDLSISYDNLSEYPEDQPPVYVDYHQSNEDATGSESTAVNDIEDETCTADGQAPFIVHGLTGDDISNLWQSDDRRTMRLKAMKYFTSGGKALGIGKSDSMESLWNNPRLYPSMFPWLFPYGLGGLGNETVPADLKMSDGFRKFNWLMYYDKRFQHDEIFSLIAFNHQQIKNSRDGGYLLTLKRNFSDVAQRLARIKVDTLDDLISRAQSGHVVPENDAERDCFKLLTDVDYVATHVDGSVTNRRRMRNEIWSMTSYLGAPSWFITFAPADINHPIALYYAGDNHTYYPSVADHSERVRMIAENPVAGARFFKFMVDMFVKHVLGYGDKSRKGLYGNTSGYYGTVEQQGRLTLHMHMLVWIRHSLNPLELRERIMSNQSEFQTRMVQYLESSHVGEFVGSTMTEMEEEVKKKMERTHYIPPTLTLPDTPVSGCQSSCGECEHCIQSNEWDTQYTKEVNELAYLSNRHKCHKGCITKSHPTCKSRFPREIHPETLVDTETGALTMKKGEAWLNYYTPALTYLMRCNTDVTSLQSGTAVTSVIQYVTDYITKSPLKTHVMFDAVKTIFNRQAEACESSQDDPTKNTRLVITKIVNALTSQSEIGSPMAAMYLLHHPDHYTDHKFRRFYWKRYVNEVRGAHLSAEEKTSSDKDGLNNCSPSLDSTDNHDAKVALEQNVRGIVGLSPVYDYIYRPVKYKDVSLYDWIRLSMRRKQVRKREKARSIPEGEWLVSRIEDHKWIKDAVTGRQRVLFNVLWDSGENTWEPLQNCQRLEALDVYYTKMRVTTWKDLPTNHLDPSLQENAEVESIPHDAGVIGSSPVEKATPEQCPVGVEGERDGFKDEGSGDDLGADIEDNSGEESDSDLDDDLANESGDDCGNESGDECDVSSENLKDDALKKKSNGDVPASEYHKFDSFSDDHPECETVKVRLLPEKDAFVPDFVGGVLPRKDKGNREEYCITMLTLFKPWRSALELKGESQSWEKSFEEHVFSTRDEEVMRNFNLRYECRDARDDFAKQRKARGLGTSDYPSYLDDDELDNADDESSKAVDVNTTEYDEDENWEDRVKEQKSAAKQLKRMIDAENMLDQNGLIGVEHPNNLNISSLPVVRDTSPSGHYWKTLLDKEKESVLRTRQGNAAAAKCKGKSTGHEDATVNKVEVIDQSYFEKSFKPASPDDRKLIKDTITRFTLNKEQARAFSIVAGHATLSSPPQLKMYLGGMAGTGKSQVIKSLIHFFKERNEEYRLMCMAPTGSAASLIGGSTYHSVLGINPYREKNDRLDSFIDVKSTLNHVDYIFMDEVSMLDCNNLYNISKQMCISLNNDEEPFGGKNMIMAGDFAQLPPIHVGNSLYSQEVESVLHTTQTPAEQEAALGKAIWHQFTTAVILRQNMRQKSQTKDDAKFRKLLENLRYKSCTKDDIRFLRQRVATRTRQDRDWCNDNFRNVSVITSYNATRDKLNERGAERFSRETKQPLMHFYSVDRYNSTNKGIKINRRAQKKRVDPLRNTDRLKLSEQFMYWSLPACCTNNHVGKLSVCIGMPVMVKKNKATECGVTNGAEGIVVGWKSHPIDQTHEALDVLFIKLTSPAIDVKLDGLEENVVPIVAESINVACKLPQGTKQTINRTQVPVILNFAMTDYASQGRTRKYNVVDLQNCRSHQSIYTCLSRGSTYQGTLITQDFSDTYMRGGLSGFLRQEFRELELLDEITELKFNKKLPKGVGGITRNFLISSYRNSKGAGYVPKFVPEPLRWNDPVDFKLQEPFEEADWKIVDAKKQPKDSSEDQPMPKKNTKTKSVAVKRRNFVAAKGSTRLETTSTSQGGHMSKKRKNVVEDGASSSPSVVKRIRTPDTLMEADTASPIPRGFIWNGSTYSCAFDSLFTILVNIMSDPLNNWEELMVNANDDLKLFNESMEGIDLDSSEMECARDRIHEEMTVRYPSIFNMTTAGNDVVELCRYMLCPASSNTLKAAYCNRCRREVSSSDHGNSTMWTCSKYAWSRKVVRAGKCESQSSSLWMKALLRTKSMRKCRDCTSKVDYVYHFREPPPFIVLSVSPDLVVNMERSMSAAGYEYKLRGLIYHGEHHFSSRVIDSSGGIWFHDGIHTKRVCEFEGSIYEIDLKSLARARHGRRLVLGIYTLS